MLVYFDTSAVMAILQKEPGYKKVMKLWDDCERPCSSILLNVEAVASVRRNLLAGMAHTHAILVTRMSELRRMLDAMALFPVEGEIAGIVEKEAALSRCRSLDAIHLATALYVQREMGESVVMCTLDVRMREAAEALRFEVFPT
jgi:predicted nucleic acid-binding protein